MVATLLWNQFTAKVLPFSVYGFVTGNGHLPVQQVLETPAEVNTSRASVELADP